MRTSQVNLNITKVSLSSLESYLSIKGWISDGEISDHAIIWHRPENENFEHEVIQPKSPEIKGFYQRIIDAIAAIADFEKRDSFYILKDIESLFSDSVKIRVVHSDVSEGTIPINDGVLLIEKSRDLLAASTLSTFTKKSYFSGQRSEAVQNFIKQLRLGQTEVGSFIVNIYAPIISPDNIQLDDNSMSITRAVTNNLSRSLLALSAVINKYQNTQDIFEFESIISKGVSANLCDALIGLSGEQKNRSFSISIALASSESDLQELPKKFNFFPEQISSLEYASAFYKGNYIIKSYSLYGLVNKLKHLPNDNFGEVSVRSVVRGVEKNISLQLSIEDYWKAFHAHKNQQYVSCEGALHVSSKSAKLIDYSSFVVVVNNCNLPET